jgi:hypothetical protein
MCKLVSVNVANLRQRATDLAKASNDSDLTLTDLRAIMRGQASLLACQADLAERVAAFEVRNV